MITCYLLACHSTLTLWLAFISSLPPHLLLLSKTVLKHSPTERTNQLFLPLWILFSFCIFFMYLFSSGSNNNLLFWNAYELMPTDARKPQQSQLKGVGTTLVRCRGYPTNKTREREKDRSKRKSDTTSFRRNSETRTTTVACKKKAAVVVGGEFQLNLLNELLPPAFLRTLQML